jgi:hypothetical protein
MFKHQSDPAPRPRNHPARLQRMVANPESRVVHWERALNPTSQRLNVDLLQAEAFIVTTVQQLRTTDFVDAVQQGGSWFDVYALYRDGLGWWIKLGEDEDGALVISHHAPERGPATTVAGTVVHVRDPRATTPPRY